MGIEVLDPVTGRTGVAAGTIFVEGDPLQLDVCDQGLGTVTGVVTAGGVPEPAAHVDVVAGAFRFGAVADAGGRDTIEGVPEGLVSVTPSVGGGIQQGVASAALSVHGATLTLDVAVRDGGGAGAIGTVAVGQQVFGELVTIAGADPRMWAAVMALCGGSAATAVLLATYRIVRMDPWRVLRSS